MRLTVRRFLYALITLYAVITVYALYYLFLRPEHYDSQRVSAKYESSLRRSDSSDEQWSPWQPQKVVHLSDLLQRLNPAGDEEKVVHVFGKAAIGDYLWQHVLKGTFETDQSGLISTGVVRHSDIEFRYRTGPGLIPSTAPDDVTNLVIVLNGRETEKVKIAESWLEYLPNFKKLRRTALVLLGNEECSNEWMEKYKREKGGILDLIFLVYDSMDVDGKTVYQWPLGVATYRNFPLDIDVDLSVNREYACNFAGTIYESSSRENMLSVLARQDLKEMCLIKPRYEWQPQETQESMLTYIELLTKSDLTLCPVGKNTECYRIYEAMSFGSTPVIEDAATPGHCSEDRLRLLKEMNAPVMFIKSWSELESLLEKETMMTEEEKVNRRRVVVRWYEWFKLQMKERFVTLIDQTFY